MMKYFHTAQKKKMKNTIFLNDKVELDVVKKDWPEINNLLKIFLKVLSLKEQSD